MSAYRFSKITAWIFSVILIPKYSARAIFGKNGRQHRSRGATKCSGDKKQIPTGILDGIMLAALVSSYMPTNLLVLHTHIFICLLFSLHREFTNIYLEQTKSLD